MNGMRVHYFRRLVKTLLDPKGLIRAFRCRSYTCDNNVSLKVIGLQQFRVPHRRLEKSHPPSTILSYVSGLSAVITYALFHVYCLTLRGVYTYFHSGLLQRMADGFASTL